MKALGGYGSFLSVPHMKDVIDVVEAKPFTGFDFSVLIFVQNLSQKSSILIMKTKVHLIDA